MKRTYLKGSNTSIDKIDRNYARRVNQWITMPYILGFFSVDVLNLFKQILIKTDNNERWLVRRLLILADETFSKSDSYNGSHGSS